MRRGFMGMMLKPRSSCHSGWEKGLLDQKSMDKLVKDQGDGCVSWLERHCPSWICTRWSDGKQTVVLGSFSTFEGCCVHEEPWIVGKPDLGVAPWQYAGSHVTPHLQLSGKTWDIRCAYFFLFPKLKTTLKGCHFQTIEDIQENHRKCIPGSTPKRTARHHGKCVPGSSPTMEETLGTVHRQ